MVKLELHLEPHDAILVLDFISQNCGETKPTESVAVQQTAPLIAAATAAARKQRKDKGQKRTPYGPRTGASAEPAPAPAPAPAPTPAPAPAPAPADVKPVASEKTDPKALTLDDARAAMKALSDTPGCGMDACIGTLREFGCMRISELGAEHYASFIAKCDEKRQAAK